MKMNKWTIGLAAVGVVSLSSVAQAQEDAAGAAAAGDAASSVEINGYVSTSYQMASGDHTGAPYANRNANNDAFTLDVIDLQIGNAKSTGDWATGFMVETWMGHQAANLGTDSDGGTNTEDFAIKQAYIDMNTPIAGLELQLGVFDTIIGYESHNHNDNALYSRSWGFSIEPTTHTGLLASYKVSDNIGVKLGVANTVDAQTNATSTKGNKTLLAAVSLKLPEGWWPWATTDKAASIDLGVITGKEGTTSSNGNDVTNFYAATDLPLPAGFSLGLAFDLQKHNGDGQSGSVLGREDNVVVGAYLSRSITDDLHATVRYEFADIPEYYNDQNIRTARGTLGSNSSNATAGDKIQSLTVGLSYDLWDNVITRLEWRVDQGDSLVSESVNSSSQVIANVIYEF